MGNVNFVTPLEQVERRLQDTDMALDADHNNLLTSGVFERIEDLGLS